jgi:peptidoglycan/LPS O-acetylase OafA/YrhL
LTRGDARFRPDLEGLRAVAVVLVLLYHAAVPGFGGGFVGVDVFYVLSGFLITGLLVRELRETGTVALPAFYARRARRLLPAAAVALVATVVASAASLPPLRVGDIAGDGVAAALYVANIRFALRSTDYLQAEFDYSPLLHYWSLGVEEQFYLFWPLFLVAVAGAAARVGRRDGASRPADLPRAVDLAVISAAVASFALSLVVTRISQPWGFFSLPTRCWELALGASVALAAFRGYAIPVRWAAAAGLAGVGMIIAAGAAFSMYTSFPGVAALLPTTGAALVIAAGHHHGTAWPSRVLGMAVPRWLGRISYSLYLWHWPLLILPAVALGGPDGLSLPARLALVFLTIPIALASQLWIEEPFRRGHFFRANPGRRTVMVGAFAGAAAIASGVVGALSVPVSTSPPASESTIERQLASIIGPPRPGSVAVGASPRPPTLAGPVPADLSPPLAKARADYGALYLDHCIAFDAETRPRTCYYGDPAARTTVVVFGDSHAAQWFPALQKLADQHHWRVLPLIKTRCAIVDHPLWSAHQNRPYPECEAWRKAALAVIAHARPDIVIASSSVWAALDINGRRVNSVDDVETWAAALGRTLAILKSSAGQVLWIGDTPQSPFDPPVCLSSHVSDALACATPFSRAVSSRRLEAERRAAGASGAAFIDPTSWVCPTEPCPAILGSALIYRDGGHMTQTFSRALAPYLAAALSLPRAER